MTVQQFDEKGRRREALLELLKQTPVNTRPVLKYEGDPNRFAWYRYLPTAYVTWKRLDQ